MVDGSSKRRACDLPDRLFADRGVQPRLQKYFCFRLTQITSRTFAIPPHQRGVSRSSETRGGMRWTRRRQARNVMQGGFERTREQSNDALTNDVAADGEVVWS